MATADHTWQRLTDAPTVHRLLDRLAASRQPVTLTHDDQQYLSLLLDVNPRHRELTFDQPPGGFRRLDARTPLRCMARVDGAGLRFAVHVATTVADDADAVITSWPQTLDHAQRRRAHRVLVPNARPLRATLFPPDAAPMRMRLIDLCAHGFGARAPERALDQLRAGRRIDGAVGLDLAPREADKGPRAIYTPITLRAVRRTGDTLHIGGEFDALDAEQQRQLDHAIQTLERYWRPGVGQRLMRLAGR